MIRKRIRVKRLSLFQKNVIMFCLCLLMLTFSISFGRYVYLKALDLYFMTQNFYFESNKLTVDGARYSLDYWNGVDPYDIPISLNGFKNDKLKSTKDITYTTSTDCPTNIICSVSKNSSTISKNVSTDDFVFTITPSPTAVFTDGTSVTGKIMAESTSPYSKTLYAYFTLVVGKYGLGHEITDKAGSTYLSLKVTNTLDSYFTKEAFGDYDLHSPISVSTYSSLSDTDKAKCASAVITVSFDPNVVKIDNTATDYLKAYDIETQVIDGYNYVKKFTFDMHPSISNVIKFYKTNKSMNYSNSNVLNVTYSYY